jgi:mRNA interferase YafQ
VRTVFRGTQFKRDVKLAEKRHKDIRKLREVLTLLIEQKPLPASYKDHSLTGSWKSFRDLHIEPDWLFIYKIDGDELSLVRTGTHSDLFGK